MKSVIIVIIVRLKRDTREGGDGNGFLRTSFSNNLDILRGHLKEKLFVEVARRQARAADPGRGLGRIGK